MSDTRFLGDLARYHEQHRDDPDEWEETAEMVTPTSNKDQHRTLLLAALARTSTACTAMESLIKRDAPQNDLVAALCELSYANGVVQGSASLYIPFHAPQEAPPRYHTDPPAALPVPD